MLPRVLLRPLTCNCTLRLLSSVQPVDWWTGGGIYCIHAHLCLHAHAHTRTHTHTHTHIQVRNPADTYERYTRYKQQLGHHHNEVRRFHGKSSSDSIAFSDGRYDCACIPGCIIDDKTDTCVVRKTV